MVLALASVCAVPMGTSCRAFAFWILQARGSERPRARPRVGTKLPSFSFRPSCDEVAAEVAASGVVHRLVACASPARHKSEPFLLCLRKNLCVRRRVFVSWSCAASRSSELPLLRHGKPAVGGLVRLFGRHPGLATIAILVIEQPRRHRCVHVDVADHFRRDRRRREGRLLQRLPPLWHSAPERPGTCVAMSPHASAEVASRQKERHEQSHARRPRAPAHGAPQKLYRVSSQCAGPLEAPRPPPPPPPPPSAKETCRRASRCSSARSLRDERSGGRRGRRRDDGITPRCSPAARRAVGTAAALVVDADLVPGLDVLARDQPHLSVHVEWVWLQRWPVLESRVRMLRMVRVHRWRALPVKGTALIVSVNALAAWQRQLSGAAARHQLQRQPGTAILAERLALLQVRARMGRFRSSTPRRTPARVRDRRSRDRRSVSHSSLECIERDIDASTRLALNTGNFLHGDAFTRGFDVLRRAQADVAVVELAARRAAAPRHRASARREVGGNNRLVGIPSQDTALAADEMTAAAAAGGSAAILLGAPDTTQEARRRRHSWRNTSRTSQTTRSPTASVPRQLPAGSR